MRLRRLELVFVGLTLAFVFFMGGFFTGRNYNSVTIEEVGLRQIETSLPAIDAEVLSDTLVINNDLSASNEVEPPIVQEPLAQTSENLNNTDTSTLSLVPGAPTGNDGKININTASKNELMDLPGIGPALADNIISYRDNNGFFNSIEDIMNVSGIAHGRFDRIKDKITV